jgi:hypothetical protein
MAGGFGAPPEDPLAPPVDTLSGPPPPAGPRQDMVPRDPPEPEPSRAALVEAWSERVKKGKAHWKPVFERMKVDQAFCRGEQWSKDPKDDRYVANLTLRLVQQRTSFLYAKNPRAVAKRRPRIENTVWDGSQAELQNMAQMGQQMAQDPMAAMQNPAAGQMMQQGMAIAQDAATVKQVADMTDRLAKTLELVYAYQVEQQALPFKAMLKNVVRRTVTTGVGYVKIGFQRAMGKRPETESKLVDASSRLATLERLAADMADQVTDENSQEAEQLKLIVQDLQNTEDFIVHEGVTFDYPTTTSIIPDPKVIYLPHFVGADWVAEEYILTPSEVQEIYGVDVSSRHNSYSRPDGGFDLSDYVSRVMRNQRHVGDNKQNCVAVWEIYSRKDGLVYVVCDGFPDFLREPAAPVVTLERFWPWFPLVFNQCDSDVDPFPPSDVHLIKDMQLEFNRARQGLREHRTAARPKTLVAAGALDEEDLDKLENHPNNAIIEIAGLQPGQDVKQLLQPYQGPGLDPNLYEVEPIYTDILRTTGIQEANMGGTSDATATQSQIAEASRMTAMGSNIDDLGDLLTLLAKAGGQICLMELAPETVQRIVGPGAVWPELSRQEMADEIWLEVEAGSMGKPNEAAELAKAERIFPLLMQIPNINPEFLAKELLTRLDDDLDLTQAFLPMPSIVSLNSAGAPTAPGAGPQPGEPPGPPGGAANAPQPPGQAGSPPPDAVQSASPAAVGPAPNGQAYQ